MLTESRMVTLTGVGGVGKTRLATRLATVVRRAFPDGVWVIELAEVEKPELLAATVMEALEIRDHSHRPSADVLVEHLRDKHMLVVLDNCEQLHDECAVLAERLLRSASHLRILATSRHVLGVAGEQTLPVPPLSLNSLDPRGTARPPPMSEAVRRSPTAPGRRSPTSPSPTPTGWRWNGSAGGWTGSRSPSSWRRCGSGCCRWTSCSTGSTIASGC